MSETDTAADTLAPGPDWSEPLPARVPRPTFWPACLAAGWVLIAYGLVFAWLFAALGLLMVAAGLAGWIGELRDEHD